MHTIRLQGPWQIEALPKGSTSTNLKATIPGDWSSALGADYRGQACFIRKFGLPTNLTSEHIFLVVEQVTGKATLELNNQSLGSQSSADGLRRYGVTTLLNLRNELRIAVESHDQPGALGQVRLEIEGA